MLRALFVCGVASAGYVPPSRAPAPTTPSCSSASDAAAVASDSAAAAPLRLDVLADPQPDVLRPVFPKLQVKTTYGLPNEYQLNQGKAIDSLRRDYPRLFTNEPDLSIFREDIELYDTSGKRLGGMVQYRRVFQILRFLGTTTMNRAEVTQRLVVTDDTIRVRWNAKLWMRGLNFGSGAEPALVHLDGVSAYELDAKGMIRLHRLENIVLTGRDQQAINLGFAWPSTEHPVPVPARPFFRSLDAALALPLPAMPGVTAASAPAVALQQPVSPPWARRTPPPMAAERFESVGETPFERAARERAEDEAKEKRRQQQNVDLFPEAKRGPFGISLGFSAPQPCESNYDCERPMVCCDLLVASVCCSSGLMIGMPSPQAQLQPQAIPIPVDRGEGDAGPRGGQFPGGEQYPRDGPW